MVAEQDEVAVRARMRFTSHREVSLTLSGELDLATAHTVGPFAGLLTNLGISKVALDLSPLTFVDVAGWRALEDLQAALRGASIEVTVDAVSPSLRRMRVLMADISSPPRRRRHEHPSDGRVASVQPPIDELAAVSPLESAMPDLATVP